MEQEQNEYTPTAFDIETQSRNIQMLKTIVPYMDSARQKGFALRIEECGRYVSGCAGFFKHVFHR